MHLQTIRTNIDDRLSPDFDGLAIIDWEDWRPIYERNFDTKLIYKTASEDKVRAEHPEWNPEEVKKEAERQFTLAARYM